MSSRKQARMRIDIEDGVSISLKVRILSDILQRIENFTNKDSQLITFLYSNTSYNAIYNVRGKSDNPDFVKKKTCPINWDRPKKKMKPMMNEKAETNWA